MHDINTIEGCTEMLRDALRSADRYVEALEPTIHLAASAFRSLSLANADINSLTSTLIETPQGKKAHPAFKIRKDAEDSLTRHLKVLGLTADALQGEEEEDELVALTNKLIEGGARKAVAKPANTKKRHR